MNRTRVLPLQACDFDPDVIHAGEVFAATMIKAAGNARVYASLVALGAIAGQPFVRVEVTGGRKAFRSMLVRQLFCLHGKSLNLKSNSICPNAG